jgi:hypothetical protein
MVSGFFNYFTSAIAHFIEEERKRSVISAFKPKEIKSIEVNVYHLSSGIFDITIFIIYKDDSFFHIASIPLECERKYIDKIINWFKKNYQYEGMNIERDINRIYREAFYFKI